MSDEKEMQPLASEMYADLKDTNRFLRKILVCCFAVIGILVIALCTTNLYHIHKWSQVERIVVGSEQGPANYVQGDNTGGIYNGEGYSQEAQAGEIQGE